MGWGVGTLGPYRSPRTCDRETGGNAAARPSGGGFLRSFISGRRSRRGRREFGLPRGKRAGIQAFAFKGSLPAGYLLRPIEGRGMLTGRTILVAEDEPLIRLDLTAALVDVGATVARRRCP